jgi:hypothetical protein
VSAQHPPPAVAGVAPFSSKTYNESPTTLALRLAPPAPPPWAARSRPFQEPRASLLLSPPLTKDTFTVRASLVVLS